MSIILSAFVTEILALWSISRESKVEAVWEGQTLSIALYFWNVGGHKNVLVVYPIIEMCLF